MFWEIVFGIIAASFVLPIICFVLFLAFWVILNIIVEIYKWSNKK